MLLIRLNRRGIAAGPHTRSEKGTRHAMTLIRSTFQNSVRLALVVLGVFVVFSSHPIVQTARSPFDSLHFRDIGPAATGGGHG